VYGRLMFVEHSGRKSSASGHEAIIPAAANRN
jgi:hypothetical protein